MNKAAIFCLVYSKGIVVYTKFKEGASGLPSLGVLGNILNNRSTVNKFLNISVGDIHGKFLSNVFIQILSQTRVKLKITSEVLLKSNIHRARRHSLQRTQDAGLNFLN